MIDCIYLPPFFKDYQTVIRQKENDIVLQLSYDEYLEHVKYINNIYPNKLQLLLQRTDGTIMPSYLIKKYISLGFNNFCVGSLEQAKIIKNINPNIKIVGSIAMHITLEKIKNNYDEYKQYFNSFVLDFSYNKNLISIKSLPKDFEYILLINSRCNITCKGDHHWWWQENFKCPGIAGNGIDFYHSCLIRPMDLMIFDPYIKVYKIQDRGWPTADILRDTVLYTQNYDIYSFISENSLYQTS